MQKKGKDKLLTNRLYDILKWVTIIGLPAIGTALLTVGEIWDLSYSPKVAETINVIILMFGAMIGISTSQYNRDSLIEKSKAGTLEIGMDGDDVTLEKLKIEMSPEEIVKREEIVFRIRKN